MVTAMVGDGANDAAAIRAASVGIGVAAEGSDPARTAADVMLLDGRIEALLDAIDEGHHLWRRVQSAVSVLLGGNAGEVCFALISSVLTGRSVLNARQMLLVNMLTDALPAAALAVSPQTETGEADRDEAAMWRAIAIRGAATTAGATMAWLPARATGTRRRASTVALIGLVSTQMLQTLGRLARSTGGDHDTRHIRCDGRGDQHSRPEPVIRVHARGPGRLGSGLPGRGRRERSLGPRPPTACGRIAYDRFSRRR